MLRTAMVPMFEASDEHVFTGAQLPAPIVGGENWALSGICGPYAGLVSSIALKIVNDRPGSEEIVQQVFTKVWRHAQAAQGTWQQVSTCKALQHIPSQERIVIAFTSWGRTTRREVALYPRFPLGTVKADLRLGMHRRKLPLQESECLDEAIQDEQLL